MMSCQFHRRRAICSLGVLAALTLPAAKLTKFKPIKPAANPPAYASFARPLDANRMTQHALSRLTFGARPGDVDAVTRQGLDHWLQWQLHPEQISENPVLESRLQPLESIRLGIHDTWSHYPPAQMIAAVARGKAHMPDDPQLRDLVTRLADRYLARHTEGPESGNKAGEPADPNDLSDLDLKIHLSEFLTPAQITALQSGSNEEKSRVLREIPPERRLDFGWALRPQQRNQLMNLAPVELRRAMVMAGQPQAVVTNDLSEAKLLRAVYSERQLNELLVDFWFNHFNVFINKGSDHFLVPTYEREAIRPNVFGHFYDLLLATAKSPAMLFYLDNWESVSPGVAERQARNRPNARRRGLNENYGRELLELHTLGVDGGYSQQDVIAVARCFTGWTIARPDKGGEFEYNDKIHDQGEKVVLGHVIHANGGMNDGLQVLRLLSRQPATAHFISLKLAKRFVADDPPPSLVARMAQTFLATDGDLRRLMETMLHSPEFWSQGAFEAKIKTPFEMVVSCLRATNADVTSAHQLNNVLVRLGEPLYRKIEPTGYSSANAEWVSSAGLLERMNFALALAQGKVTGVSVDSSQWSAQTDPMRLANALLPAAPSLQTAQAIQKMLSDPEMQKQLAANAKAGPPQVSRLVAGLALGSPDFQHR